MRIHYYPNTPEKYYISHNFVQVCCMFFLSALSTTKIPGTQCCWEEAGALSWFMFLHETYIDLSVCRCVPWNLALKTSLASCQKRRKLLYSTFISSLNSVPPKPSPAWKPFSSHIFPSGWSLRVPPTPRLEICGRVTRGLLWHYRWMEVGNCLFYHILFSNGFSIFLFNSIS